MKDLPENDIEKAKLALQAAEEALQAATAAAETRRHRIRGLQLEIESLIRELEVWNQTDFEEAIKEAEAVIISSHGSQDCGGRILDIYRFETLLRLKPTAVTQITARLKQAEAELAKLDPS
jgi:hypothetical protein